MNPFTAPRETNEPAPVAVPLEWPALYARRAAYVVHATAICLGLAYGAKSSADLPTLAGLAVGWAIAYFCALDARAHKLVFPRAFWMITSLSWPIAALVHLVRVRGARGVTTYGLHALLFALCTVAGAVLGAWLTNNF